MDPSPTRNLETYEKPIREIAGRKSLLHPEAGVEGGSIAIDVRERVIDVAEGRLE